MVKKLSFVFISILIMVILLSSVVLASENIDVEIRSVKDSILPGETAIFDLIIKNRRTTQVEISVKSPQSLTSRWSVLTSPISGSKTTLGAGESRKIALHVQAIDKNVEYGTHDITVRVESTNVATQGKSEDLSVFSLVLLDPKAPYLSIEVRPEYPENINPLEHFTFKLSIDNMNSLSIDDVDVKITGELFNAKHKISIKPFANQTIDFDVNPNRYAASGVQLVDVELSVGDKKVSKNQFTLNVQKVDLPFDIVDFKHERSFLKSRRVYSLHNPSNIRKDGKYLVPVSFFGRILSSAEPSSLVVDGNYVLSSNLGPNETKVFTITYSYVSIFVIIIILLILLAVYNIFRPELYINRKYVRVKLDEERNFVSCKVIVHIRNSTSYPLRNVRVVEEIPALARYVVDDDGLRPSKLSTEEYKASRLVWDFAELEARDERIMTYYVRGTFNVMGGFDMPPTVASYDKSGVHKVIYGGTLRIVVRK